MNENKVAWCLKQKKGMAITELKPHLSRAYMSETDETLENVSSAKGKWKTITAYYACYNALYSLLMKCGIKCEIHDCSIELMGLFGFTESESEFMKQLKEDRIQAQYYLQKRLLKDEGEVKKFVLRCKMLLSDLNSEKIESVRKSVISIRQEAKRTALRKE